MKQKKSGRKSGEKVTSPKPGTFQPGHDDRRGRGPEKGAPNAGRPSDEFRKRLVAIRDTKGLTVIETVLDGKVRHTLVGVCPECGYESDEKPTELNKIPDTADMLRAADMTMKYTAPLHVEMKLVTLEEILSMSREED